MSAPDPQKGREYLRGRALRGLRIYFSHRRWPRLVMSGVLAITGGVGFLASYVMLHAGLEKMWLRYPAAVLFAWVAFLGLVRLWAEVERRAFSPDNDLEKLLREGRDPGDEPSTVEVSGDAVGRWLDAATSYTPDSDEGGCLVWFFVMVVGALLLLSLAGLYTVLMAAPVLLAEVFLDAVLVTALYKRMAHLDRRWWLTGAMERTAVPVLLTAGTLMIAGATMQALAPGAKSVGGVWKRYRNPPSQLR